MTPPIPDPHEPPADYSQFRHQLAIFGIIMAILGPLAFAAGILWPWYWWEGLGW